MKTEKRPLNLGLLAHVDAGKTTLSEALLFESGARRVLGRVDHQDAFLDTYALERSRGITIFSKQARLETEHRQITLVDTPGHVDFAPEAERTMPILDCAVLVISGTDGVQAHTLTLWRLLERYGVPTFLFINKMDLPGADREKLMTQLHRQLSPACVDFGEAPEKVAENAAMCDEALLESYLETGSVTAGNLRGLIADRRLFPCCFGSALKLEGVEKLLEILDIYAPERECSPDFAAGVLPSSAEGASHFADVRALFLLDLAVLAMTLLFLLGLWVACRRRRTALPRLGGRTPGFWAACGLGGVILIVAALAATDFDRAFTIFHGIFFPGKENWLFDPATDPVILLLPEEFFHNCAIAIAASLLGLCLVLALTGRKQKK